MVDRINPGQAIKAKFLNDIADEAEGINTPVLPPTQTAPPPNQDITNEDSDFIPDYAFSEVSRLTSTVQIFDQNDENYAEIERIESVTFENGKGEKFRLDFNNG